MEKEERPIIMSPQMVEAILEGRKTQTRRPVKPQPPRDTMPIKGPEDYCPKEHDREGYEKPGPIRFGAFDEWGEWSAPFPYLDSHGDPVEWLWVRETFALSGIRQYIYKADGWVTGKGWKPSIHMPREACRLLLKVEDIRLQWLHEIGPTDTFKEGIDRTKDGPAGKKNGAEMVAAFDELWDSIYKHPLRAKDNPLVWVIEFSPVRTDEL